MDEKSRFYLTVIITQLEYEEVESGLVGFIIKHIQGSVTAAKIPVVLKSVLKLIKKSTKFSFGEVGKKHIHCTFYGYKISVKYKNIKIEKMEDETMKIEVGIDLDLDGFLQYLIEQKQSEKKTIVWTMLETINNEVDQKRKLELIQTFLGKINEYQLINPLLDTVKKYYADSKVGEILEQTKLQIGDINLEK